MADKQPHDDGGMASRKLWFAVFTSFLIFIGGMISWLRPAYEAAIAGLLGALGIYSGANVVTKKWTLGSSLKTKKIKKDEPKDEDLAPAPRE